MRRVRPSTPPRPEDDAMPNMTADKGNNQKSPRRPNVVGPPALCPSKGRGATKDIGEKCPANPLTGTGSTGTSSSEPGRVADNPWYSPNQYTLTGEKLTITYNTSGHTPVPLEPSLTYNDGQQLPFKGAQIRATLGVRQVSLSHPANDGRHRNPDT